MEPTTIHEIDRESEYSRLNPKRKYWTTDDSACEICGTRFRAQEDVAEMFDPDAGFGSIICHHSCGQTHKLELA